MTGPQIPTVHGWLMDEISRQNPDGFAEWLVQDASKQIIPRLDRKTVLY